MAEDTKAAKGGAGVDGAGESSSPPPSASGRSPPPGRAPAGGDSGALPLEA